MDRTSILIMAGMFSRTNMGLALPELESVQQIRKNPPRNVEHSVVHFCESLIESDEMEQMFYEEGRMWVSELSGMEESEARRVWPDHFKLFDDADPKIAG